jgi:transposase
MVRQRGYPGAVGQVRRAVRLLRPAPKAAAYLRLHLLPGEQGQADWGSFGTITIGRATRRLSAFVLVLSWSRALHAVCLLDQSLESFLRGHVEAFGALHGVPRILLYDNMKSAVLERQGEAIRFHLSMPIWNSPTVAIGFPQGDEHPGTTAGRASPPFW